jgi:mono/diheme cytochrome c family protein
MALFVLMPLQMLVQSFRGASAVVHFTAWETAFEQLVLFGPFTLWAAAALVHVLPSVRGRSWSLGRIYLWTTVAGLAVVLSSSWIAGLQQGYTWIAGVNSQAYPNSGAGFRNSVVPLQGLDWVQVAGFVILLAGVIVFLVPFVGTVFGAWGAGDPDREERPGAPVGGPLRVVLGGAALLFAAALVGVVLVPLYDTDTEPSLLAEDTRDFAPGSAAAEGREIYLREGCWYCHTQQVRAIVTDVGLGAVSVPGDYAFDDADLLGVRRIGPDLAHYGSRAEGSIVQRLADPRGGESGDIRSWSTMPAYDHLPADEIDALAAYLAALE